MIFKILVGCKNPQGEHSIECKVFAIEKECDLELRVINILDRMDNDGYENVRLLDCFNLSYPDIFQNHS